VLLVCLSTKAAAGSALRERAAAFVFVAVLRHRKEKRVKSKLPIVLSGVALVVAVLGTTTPAIAHGVQHALFAHNADKVDGRHANQIARATTISDSTDVDNFNSATHVTLLSKSVTAPTKGILLVWGTVAAARDANMPDEGILKARIRLGSGAMTAEQNVNLENAATADGSIAISAAFPVLKGTKTVILEAVEVGPGMAYIHDKSITTLFVPFGNAGQVGVLGRPAQTSDVQLDGVNQ
jgi:hypothetical protein